MDFDGLDRQLRDSLADLKLSNEERDELRQLGSELAPDQVRFLRNRAFDLVRELVLVEEQGERIAALKWLEQVVRTLRLPRRRRAAAPAPISVPARSVGGRSANCAGRPGRA